MKLSEMESHLAGLRARYGDVEVWEAIQEYGRKEITPDSLKKIIWVETTRYPKENRSEEHLMIGRH